jgi:hypothetical protein
MEKNRYDPIEDQADDIEQALDMKEDGPLRGEEVLRQHHRADTGALTDRFAVDMSEDGREGDEESGDDHSSGLQGGEQELIDQPHIDSGVPGDEAERSGDPDLEVRDGDGLIEPRKFKETA